MPKTRVTEGAKSGDGECQEGKGEAGKVKAVSVDEGGDRRCSMCSARTGLADVQAGGGLFSLHSFIGFCLCAA